MASVAYCTREDVKQRLDFAEIALSNSRIDAATLSASRDVDSLIKYPDNGIAPTIATYDFNWPDVASPTPWRLWLDDRTLISVTSIISGGITIPPANYLLEPQRYGAPFDRVEIDISTVSTFNFASTWQRSIVINGLWGWTDDSGPAGSLAASIASAGAVACNVTDSNAIGVGQVITVDSERMIVTGKTMLTTAQTLQTPVGATMAEQTMAVTNGALYAVGEILLLDAERMLITDIAGNNLIVKRAYDGSTLAAHSGSTIFAARILTIVRGQLGTTAATHSNGAAITKWLTPDKARELAIAESINRLLQETSGYARTVGAADAIRNASGAGLEDARARCYASMARQGRVLAV